jgi:hypothetical protein
MNTNNSTNIREKKSKSFPGMPIGTRRSCLMKKSGHEKSHDTVPLTAELTFARLTGLNSELTVPTCVNMK